MYLSQQNFVTSDILEYVSELKWDKLKPGMKVFPYKGKHGKGNLVTNGSFFSSELMLLLEYCVLWINC